jgi:hypothetical protein
MPTQTPSEAVHLPVDPHTPESYKQLRYFSRGTGTNGYRVQGGGTNEEMRKHPASADIKVIRFADEDYVRVEQRLITCNHSSTSQLACTAQDLRAIALRLLDAAHDLEANPAANLMATLAMAEGGAA